MPLAPTCDVRLRAALRKRVDSGVSLRKVGAATDIPFTTLADYARSTAGKDGVSYKTNITLAQAERLAKYLGLKIKMVKA